MPRTLDIIIIQDWGYALECPGWGWFRVWDKVGTSKGQK